jgi:hypothetical protein
MEKIAQYCEAAYWDQCNVYGLCEARKEFCRSFDQATSKRVGARNMEGDMTDTQIMILWLISNLYDWRSHEWDLMENEVTSDHGEVLSFYVYPLS